jgi:hypothetical protein
MLFCLLQHPDLQLDSLSDILPTLPDVSIAYKLYLECSRYINLFDWYQVPARVRCCKTSFRPKSIFLA